MPLLAHKHGDGLVLKVRVGLAADIDGYPLDGAAGEAPWHLPRVVAGNTCATVASDAKSLAGERELAGLSFDRGFADLLVPVEQRQGPVGDARRVLARLLERRREDHVFAGGKVLAAHDLLGEAADEVVDIVETVVLYVKRVPAEPRTMREQHALGVGRGQIDQCSDRE